jgi:hypothetical protein
MERIFSRKRLPVHRMSEFENITAKGNCNMNRYFSVKPPSTPKEFCRILRSPNLDASIERAIPQDVVANPLPTQHAVATSHLVP